MAKVVFENGQVRYNCPGCGYAHAVPAKEWNWNGDTEKPTLSPSVRHYYTHPETKKEITVCHYNIVNGKIEYCDDCPHELKNQKIELPEIS